MQTNDKCIHYAVPRGSFCTVSIVHATPSGVPETHHDFLAFLWLFMCRHVLEVFGDLCSTHIYY